MTCTFSEYMLSFHKTYIEAEKKTLPAEKWDRVCALLHKCWTCYRKVAACEQLLWGKMSVWQLKEKAFLIKGPHSSGEALINTSWKRLHPGGPALGFHWDGRGGCFPKSTDWDPIFLWSLVCWLLAPIYVLPTPQSIHRLSGGKRITWSDASSKPSILTIATVLGTNL